jgi:putative ABC transport system permease protein
MNLSRLAVRNILNSAFRSGMVVLCAAMVAGITLAATMVVWGAEGRLRYNLERMGADILVVPWGTWRASEMEGARLMNMTDDEWMPQAYVQRVAAVQGVAAVSAQRHLFTMPGFASCPAPEVFVVAFDPESDFAVQPWWERRNDRRLGPDEALVGSCMRDLSVGDTLNLRGHAVQVAGILQPTGSDVDQAVFVSFETAQSILESSRANGLALNIVPDSISAILVRVEMGSDPHDVAVRILTRVRNVLPVESTNLFQTQRAQMIGLLRSVLGLLAVIWGLSTLFVGLVFSVAANERRREIGVLRALGCPRPFVVRLLLTEGAVLALAGGIWGVVLVAGAAALLKDAVTRAMDMPFLLPAPAALIGVSLGGLLLALLSVMLAALFPALKISREEAAITMRE